MSSQNVNTDEMHLAEQIQKGDKSAFSHLFDLYYQPLCEYAFRYCNGDAEVMEDIVQEVFVRIWEKRDSWNPKVAVRAYLYRSVHNQAITNIRKKRYETPMKETIESMVVSEEQSPLDILENEEIDVSIKQAIALLPERRREILTLRIIHGLSYKEIAAVLDISVNTVDTQLRRALKLLREKLTIFHPMSEAV